MLVTAAYISVFAKNIFGPDGWWNMISLHYAVDGGDRTHAAIAFVVLALLPIALTAIQFPHMCVDYVMASGIEDLISEEELHRTVVNQRAESIVKLLKMLALARKQKLMLGSLLEEQGSVADEPLADEGVELPAHFKDEIADLWQI